MSHLGSAFKRTFGVFVFTLCLVGCQPPSEAPDIDVDALMEGSWEIERANVTFFNFETDEILAGPVEVTANEPVPVQFNPTEDPVMLTFGGSYHFGEGASRWSRIYITIMEDGVYIRNQDEEIAAEPPPFGDPNAGTLLEDWAVDENLRLVLFTEQLHVEAMVDMAEDGETVWLDYDREAQDFSDGSCINNVTLRRTVLN